MSDGEIVLRISGLDTRNGQVPAEAFTSVIRRFAATIAFLERIYTSRSRRSADLNVAYLARENPLVVGLNPTARVRGYSPIPAIGWGFSQIEGMSTEAAVDPRIPVELLDNVFDLADQDSREDVSKFVAQFDGYVIDFNGKLAQSVRAKRNALVESMPGPRWFAGISQGVILGELRGVTDLDGEREFFIVPPRGAKRIKCVFTEEMRSQMNRHLFKWVQIRGLVHYDGNTPYASLVEAESIASMEEKPLQHMSELYGLFKDSYYPARGGWPQ